MNTCGNGRTGFLLLAAVLFWVLWSQGQAAAQTSGGGVPSADSLSFARLSGQGADATSPLHGVAEGTGTHFAVTDSAYLDVTLDSSETVTVRLSSSPEMVIISFEPSAGKPSTEITLGGFIPLTTYYKYEDNYHNKVVFTTDPAGVYTFTQDISAPHLVYIQPRKSTKFISDNETGGDCASIGVWDGATKTCTLTVDLNETVQIDSDYVTLDGNGHTLTGTGTGFGVYVPNRTGVTVTRVNVRNFGEGINLYSSSSCTVSENSTSFNTNGAYWGGGIHLDSSSNNTVTGNTSSNNVYCGVALSYADNNIVTGNTLTGNAVGFRMDYSHMNTVSGNTATGNGTGFQIGGSNYQLEQMNNLIENNNALNNTTGIALVGNYNTLRANTASQNTIGINVYRGRQNVLTDNVTQENRDFDVIFNWTILQGTYGMMQGAGDCTNTLENTTGSGGRPIKYFNSAATVQNEVLAGLILCKANGSTVSNVTIAGSDTLNNNGMLVIATNNATISNVTSVDNKTGIYLAGSSFNVIQNNNVQNNEDGVRLSWSSTDNTVSGNTVLGNSRVGVYSHHGVNSNLAIRDNVISGGSIGIACESPGATNTDITGNRVSNAASWGIDIYAENGNRIFNNTVLNSTLGLNFQDANNMQVYNNNFIDNVAPASISGGSGNLFNLAKPVGGNYWSSFDSPGEGCTDLDNDRFCDAPYVLGIGAVDNLPRTIQDAWIAFQVTPVAGPNGTITPSTPQTVPYLQTAVFTIMPASGYHIDTVTGCNGTLNGTTYTTAPITADCTTNATFAINSYTVTPVAGPNGAIIPSSPQTVQYLQTALFTLVSYTGYHIDAVTGCNGTLNGNTYTTAPVTADCTINATFAINRYTVTPVAGPNGTISPAVPQLVDFIKTTSFLVTPDSGYRIALVTGCSGTLNGNTYTTGPVVADCTVNAIFAQITYTLNVAKTGTGSGTVTSAPPGISCGSTCAASFAVGTPVVLSAATSTTSTFAGWSGGGCSGTGTCTVIMNANTTVTAAFNQMNTITVTAPNGGEIWNKGGTYTIRWNYTGNPGSNVKIELLKGGVLNRTITSSTSVGSGGGGSYSWKIQKNQANASSYTVRITSTTNSGYQDISNANFTIK